MELGSLTRAARALNVSQPTLTRQVALLEHGLRAKLLERTYRGVTPTEAGSLLYERAVHIVDQLDSLELEIQSREREPVGTVGLGLSLSLLEAFREPVVQRYSSQYRRVLMRVYQGLSNELEDKLASGQIDMAILMYRRKPMHNVRMTELAGERLFLAGPNAAGLRPDKPVALDQLIDLPLVGYGTPNNLQLRLTATMAKMGRSLRVVAEVHDLSLMLNLVSHGSGYCVLPMSALEQFARKGLISVAPLGNMAVVWTLAVSSARPYSPAIRALEKMVRDAFAAMVASGALVQAPEDDWDT